MREWSESAEEVRALPLRARTEYLLRRFGLQPRKSLGQSFLINEGAARQIAQIAAEPRQPLVEVGGGLGALTVPLAAAGLPLTVVEIDEGGAAALAWLTEDLDNVRVVQEDFLRVEWETLAEPTALPLSLVERRVSEGSVTAVGNLPYNSAGAILQRLWARESPCDRIVVMVQREVAERLRAAPGSKAWGPLSVLAALHTQEREVRARLGPGSFWPAPRVESTVLCLQRRLRLPEALVDYAAVAEVLRAAFGSRRKRLSNSLRLSLGLEPTAADEILRRAGLDGGRRGETLSLDEIIDLANAIHATGLRGQ